MAGMSDAPARPLWRQRGAPELHAAIFHFSVYFSNAVASVYFAIWLSNRGLRADEIGVISALPVLIMLAINLFVGRIADKASDWRQVIAILALVSGAASIGMLFVNSFWGILLVWSIIIVPSGSIPPVIDAATVRLTQRNGSDFGFVRAWGTVGYVFATAVAGLTVALWGDGAFVPLFIVLTLGRAALSLQLPLFRAPERQATIAAVQQKRAGRLREVMQPWFVLPILGFGMIQAAHAVLSSFVALVWHQHGIGEAMIGPLIATAPAAEAAMMFAWKRFGGRVSARHMILAAALVTVLRWTLMAFNPPVILLFVLQASHAVTYALGYFGTVHFIANWTSEDIAAEAQGFAFILQQSITVVTLLGFGWLLGLAGDKAFLAMAGLGVLASGCVLVSLRLRSVKAG